MLKYIIIFTGLGYVLSLFVAESKALVLIFCAIAFAWGLATAPIWGLVTLGELFLGYGIKTVLSSGSKAD